MGIVTAKAVAVSAAALAVSGCATYASRPPQLVYYAVPCDTPGAFQAQLSPASLQPTFGAAPGDAPRSVEGQASAGAAPTCLVAAQVNDRGYANDYGGYGPYFGYGGYGSPFYGSVGIGIGFHGGGYRHSGYGHGSFGHRGGGHGGGHGTH